MVIVFSIRGAVRLRGGGGVDLTAARALSVAPPVVVVVVVVVVETVMLRS